MKTYPPPLTSSSSLMDSVKWNVERNRGGGEEAVSSVAVDSSTSDPEPSRLGFFLISELSLIQALCVGVYEKEVIGDLMRKVQSGRSFGYEETIQTAISAVLKMTRMVKKPGWLKVCVWKKGSQCTDQLSDEEILEHLEAIINGDESLFDVRSHPILGRFHARFIQRF